MSKKFPFLFDEVGNYENTLILLKLLIIISDVTSLYLLYVIKCGDELEKKNNLF
jgi:hypothetical protein